MQKLIILYNGESFFNNSCNICKAEINHYKKICNENIDWIDVTDNAEA